jgi:short-subunit dehydrogenase
MNWRAEYGPSAVITGASAGLGAEYASQLAARGLDLVLIARREERLEALAAELRGKHGVRVQTLVLDLLAEDAPEQLQALAAEQEIGLLINNAGFSYSGHFLEAEPATYRRMTRLNCELPTLLAQIFLRPMVARGRGGMILLASMSAFQATPYCTVYGATKGFNLLLGEGLAVELADSGLTLQTVCPGSTSTELQTVAGVPEDYVEKRMTPGFVVERSLQTFGRVAVLIPSRKQALLIFLQRFGSRGIAARIAGKLLRRRLP